MLYAVLLEDDPAHADARTRHLKDHLAFLDHNASVIRYAGPLKDSKNGEPAGGMWLVDAPNDILVRTLVESDPFWPTGLRKSVRILEWTLVHGAGNRIG